MNNAFSLTSFQQEATATHAHDPEGTASQYSASPVGIRAARVEDLSSVADLLSESFYPGTHEIGWLAPLLRLGLHRDLRGRLKTGSSNHLCLIAAPGDTQTEGS
ncbi:MAG TPA: hypothetical protein V6D03_08880, partial [Candidatus Caenarcaniphilales bacterium]